jgi:putative chitinase
MQPTQVLIILLLGGLMGLVGQGARTIVGLKKMYDTLLASAPSESDLFDASRLVVSLIIGFIAGVVTTIPLLGKLAAGNDPTPILLAIAAAGYVGTDAIESFMTRIVPTAGTNPAATSTGVANVAALLDKYSFVDPASTGDVEGAVVQCTNAELIARGFRIDDDYKMNSYYGFSEPSMGPFLFKIQTRLTTLKFKFGFQPNDRAFIDKCIPLTLGDFKDAVAQKTVPA